MATLSSFVVDFRPFLVAPTCGVGYYAKNGSRSVGFF